MKTAPEAVRPFALAGVFLLMAGGASAGGAVQRETKGRDEAERVYQAGVDQYAYGHLPQALSAFEEALRRDPTNEAARTAIDRVRQELAMSAVEGAPVLPRRDDGPLQLGPVERLLEWSIAEEQERAGRLLALQGRISQLLAEKKVCRARGRAFRKDPELHALSRRLS